IQIKLEREAQYQQFSEYKNLLPTQGLPSIQSIFFESIYNKIRKDLILESASVQNAQISQSVLYHACLYEVSNNLTLFSSAHEYEEDTAAAEFDTVEFGTSEEMNQVISIHGHNAYQASIHANITEKQEYAHGFVNEFVGLIVKFIDSHNGVATSKCMTIDISQIKNPKKLKHKGRPRLLDSAQQNTLQDLNTNCNLNSRQDKLRREDEIETENKYSETSTSKVEVPNQ
ncbi:45627_t:CDS:2, partial [Gigaspora margarita]